MWIFLVHFLKSKTFIVQTCLNIIFLTFESIIQTIFFIISVYCTMVPLTFILHFRCSTTVSHCYTQSESLTVSYQRLQQSSFRPLKSQYVILSGDWRSGRLGHENVLLIELVRKVTRNFRIEILVITYI